MAELFLGATALFLLFLLFFLPPGRVLLAARCPSVSPLLACLLALGLSAVFWAGVTSLLIAAGVRGIFFQALVLLLLVGFCWGYLRTRCVRELREPAIARGLVISFLYYLLIVAAAAFPALQPEDLSAATGRRLSGYAIDNLISYNTARYFVEDIAFFELEVVPTWSVTERGPLAGILTANIQLLLGVSERDHWLSTSTAPYFVFQCLLTFLNVTSLLTVWLLAWHYHSPRAAGSAAALLGTTSFFFINTLFTWPKLFMSTLVLTAFAVWLERRNIRGAPILCGILLGAGMLAHDIAVFYLAAFFGYLGCLVLRHLLDRRLRADRAALRGLASACATLLGTVVLVLLPWALVRMSLGASSRRLLYMHVFCINDYDIEKLSLLDAIGRYLGRTPPLEVLQARLLNLLYPFDLTHVWPLVRGRFGDFYYLFHALSEHASYQLIFALGPLLFLLLLFGLVRRAANGGERRLMTLTLLSFGGLVAAAAVFGCPRTTWNHAWVYPLYVACALPAGAAVARGERVLDLLFGLAVGLNLLLFVFNYWFNDTGSVFFHAAPRYLAMQILLILAFLSAAILGGTPPREEPSR